MIDGAKLTKTVTLPSLIVTASPNAFARGASSLPVSAGLASAAPSVVGSGTVREIVDALATKSTLTWQPDKIGAYQVFGLGGYAGANANMASAGSLLVYDRRTDDFQRFWYAD